MKRHLEYKDETSNKFWEISVVGNEQIVRFGRIGTEGQEKRKSFSSGAEAESSALKQIESKLAKGYSDSGAASEQKKPTEAVVANDRDLQEMVDSGDLMVGPPGAALVQELAQKNNIRRLSQLLKIPPVNLSAGGAREIQRALADINIRWGKTLPAPKPPKNGIPKWIVSYAAATTEEATDRMGGRPSEWQAATEWPACAQCKSPMEFLLQLIGTAANGKVDLGAFGALQVFACPNEACRPYRALGGGNQALLRQRLEGSLASQEIAIHPAHRIELAPGFDSKILATPDTEDEEKYYEALDLAHGDKIGGINVESEWGPKPCPVCGNKMNFLARLTLPFRTAGLGDPDSPTILQACLSCGQAAFQQLTAM